MDCKKITLNKIENFDKKLIEHGFKYTDIYYCYNFEYINKNYDYITLCFPKLKGVNVVPFRFGNYSNDFIIDDVDVLSVIYDLIKMGIITKTEV